MTMLLDDLMHGLNGRTAIDGVIVAWSVTLGLWLDALRVPAQEFVFWGTVVLVLGRLILLAWDFLRLWRGRVKSFPRERFDGRED